MITATCQEQKHRKKAKQSRKKGERKIESNYCFHSLNKYSGIEALSEFRSGFLC